MKGLAKGLGVLLLAFGAHLSWADNESELETVPYVDVYQYVGKWYEIARLPQIFQPACTAVTADYGLNDDGTLSVFNFCRILHPKYGFPISVQGTAVPLDDTNSKLAVSFFDGKTNGNYWVLELDPAYQWSLVGDPDRSSLYILSRTPQLNEAIVDELLELAVTKHGYNIDHIIMTKQLPN
ncbi:lipocalin family protein [Microbulbifer sp. THAF38]|uniref:lipocalin family protein n=1 Tax=Microbulbifer sp. THAF38 TaxID=2587856 RepID=UPI0012678B39|nr:lipocalin family protein [Microbulbifer sp. THAF38]QFT54944.1 Outer membrane lipoprotein Blc precursor [Microbulbifer sp. THAF38]